MWQENQADNARLETDLALLRLNLEKTHKRLILYNQKVSLSLWVSRETSFLSQAVLSSVEYEDYVRNEAEIREKAVKLEKELKGSIT